VTISLPTRRGVHRGRVISNVAVIDLPRVVRTNMFQVDQYGGRLEAHDLGADGINTRCGTGVALLDIIATVEIRERRPWWCVGCWPTDRYCHCGCPSGQDTVCSLCGAVAQDADDRIAGADS